MTIILRDNFDQIFVVKQFLIRWELQHSNKYQKKGS